MLKGLAVLANALNDFESRVKASKVLSVETYQRQMYRAYMLSLRPVLPSEIF